jgi:chemotaxis protein MotB
MRKRRRREEHDSADRWVVSYADFITLLFAFFTTMYAISHVDQGKLERFAGSMQTAFRVTGVNTIGTVVIEGIKPANYSDITLESDIRTEFKKFDIIEGIGVLRDSRGVVVSLGDTLLFESGSADMKREALPLLTTVGALIKKSQRPVLVEGHTDNIPLRSPRYSSNLELSAARAANVFGVLLEEGSIAPDRATVSGYGQYRPIASNATPEERARNRRVDIVFVSRESGT